MAESNDIGSTDPGLSTSVELGELRRSLLEWYRSEQRSFPWRRTDDPYEILVCEVMSQQTQLERVVPAWEAFLDHWPTPAELASADRSAVIAFWSDHRLGYNNRAKYLHSAAQRIETEWDGSLPATTEGLQTLPGVGPYTAHAVASFAFDRPTAVVDTNVKRVLYRLLGSEMVEAEGYQSLADSLLPDDRSRPWNNAIMELGALTCTKSPQCDERNCPWRQWCHAYRSGDFTAPDVPQQPTFSGSNRQLRGATIRMLSRHGELTIDELEKRIHEETTVDMDRTDSSIRSVVSKLADDGMLVVRSEEIGDRIELPQ